MSTEACMNELPPGNAATAVGQIRFFVPRAVLTVGERARLAVATEDLLGTEIPGVPITWTSSAPGTVSVDAGGHLEALGTGEARITAAAGAVATELTVLASRVSLTAFGVHPARATLCAGEQAHLEVDVSDHRGMSRDPRIIDWTSSDPGIARVSPDGRVTAVTCGQVRITASTSSLSAVAAVEVVPLVASNLSVAPATLALEHGATERLKAVVLSQRGTPMDGAALRWQSSDPKTVWVDDGGSVRGVAPGVVKIRVTCGNFSAVSTVRVFARRA